MVDAEEAKLHRAVLADPDDHAARLALADWYDANQNPRGELIRLQLAAAKASDPVERARLREKAYALLDVHRETWLAGKPEYVESTQFRRGFVEMVSLDAAEFVRHASELYAWAPIRMLVLTAAQASIRELARAPEVERIVRLVLPDAGLGDAEVADLMQSPHLRRLKVLELPRNRIGTAGVEAIAAATSRLPSLVHVNLVGNPVDNPSERFGEDPFTGVIVRESIALPELGEQLEAKYGYQAWLHGPSQLANWPPSDDDL